MNTDKNPYSPASDVLAQAEAETKAAPVEDKAETPWWGYGFMVACLAIMILTRGGAIWGALGGGVGSICMKVSQNQNMPVAMKLTICAAITGTLWVAIAMLVMAARG